MVSRLSFTNFIHRVPSTQAWFHYGNESRFVSKICKTALWNCFLVECTSIDRTKIRNLASDDEYVSFTILEPPLLSNPYLFATAPRSVLCRSDERQKRLQRTKYGPNTSKYLPFHRSRSCTDKCLHLIAYLNRTPKHAEHSFSFPPLNRFNLLSALYRTSPRLFKGVLLFDFQLWSSKSLFREQSSLHLLPSQPIVWS